MPAVLVLRSADNPVPDSSGKWYGGMVVVVTEQDAQFGFQEMPINAQGSFTVTQVNGIDITTLPLYAGIQCSDGGVVTSGAGPDVDVVAGDVIVKQFGDILTNFGQRTEVPIGFYHIRISNRTVEQVSDYMLQPFNKELSYRSDQYNPPTGNRRFTTTNEKVSASGKNGFTADGIQDVISTWNTDFPDNTITLVDTDNLSYFQCDGIMPTEVFADYQLITEELAFGDISARRQWYITQAGLDVLAANDGIISGTAAQVSPYLRDGLLD